MRLLFLTLIVGSLSGCSAHGKEISYDQMKRFERGKSTYNDVINAFGDPHQVTVLPDETEMLCYHYQKIAVHPETFIPVVGALVGGADVRMDLTCFNFDNQRVLQSYTTTSSQTGRN